MIHHLNPSSSGPLPIFQQVPLRKKNNLPLHQWADLNGILTLISNSINEDDTPATALVGYFIPCYFCFNQSIRLPGLKPEG